MDVLLQVLDWLLRGLGLVVVLALALLFVVWVWDLAQPKPKGLPLAPPSPEADQETVGYVSRQSVPKHLLDMGWEGQLDYTGMGGQLSDRLGDCYMLAAKALRYYNNGEGDPMPAGLIHGSMHGPKAKARIGHAIVLLDDGRIWEPITAGIYNREQFESYCRWERHQIYSVRDAMHFMRTTETFGPWV